MQPREDEVRALWEKEHIFEKSVEARKNGPNFVFFEGPPTANGLPHMGHLETRAFKDVVLRYKTMQGFYAPRRAGWDTQGLPVEIEIEKKLDLKTKKDIEAFGIAQFNAECKTSAQKYREEWIAFSEKLGFWIDYSKEYLTYTNDYLESLWWVMKEIWKKKLLFEDYKILPWCTRCETGLSSHELAQEYRTVTDETAIVKFALTDGQRIAGWDVPKNTFVLAWTTTPWTLPGNVALAVSPRITYSAIQCENGDTVIVASTRAVDVRVEGGVLGSWNGEELAGLSYTPLFAVEENTNAQSHKMYVADFVTDTDGTGVVHIAPMYGVDDFTLGKEGDLPRVHTVNTVGHFEANVGSELAGKYVKSNSTTTAILETLRAQGSLFSTAPYTHEYPYCWRCKSPIIYYARKSWWIGMSQLREQMVEANTTVAWEPKNVGEGRFGEWIKEAKDWAFSRERYWGTPLPIWRCGACGADEVVGSLVELRVGMRPLNNTYFVMRHGQSENNVLNLSVTKVEHDHYGLTDEGKRIARESLEAKKAEGVVPDMIIASDFVRTKETAEIARDVFELPPEKLMTDPRLREYDVGAFDGKTWHEYLVQFGSRLEQFTHQPTGGETMLHVRARMLELFDVLESEHKGKTIFLVSHAAPLWMLETGLLGMTPEESLNHGKEKIEGTGDFFPAGSIRQLYGPRMPTNEDGVLDLHRPFIDRVELSCPSCDGVMTRVPELADVWFDSGAMPYAQWHYPFEHAEMIDEGKAFPADYIVEGIDQTRGWFYTLLAVSTLLGRPAPYKHVIALGHVMDAKGKKLSKSLGNYTPPMELLDTHGADALRWYIFAVNQPGDSILFDEREVVMRKRGSLDLLANSLVFWKTASANPAKESKNILDAWVLARLSEVITQMTKELDAYEITRAIRELELFISEDVSRWYIRRSRDRMKDGEHGVLREVLKNVAILSAPFVPYIAEQVYQEIGGDRASVHLEDWPSAIPSDEELLSHMERVRTLASAGLLERASAGMKIRQPLASATIRDELPSDIAQILAEELNVKEILVDKNLADETPIVLDVTLTDALKQEGALRDFQRLIQQCRKESGAKPGEMMTIAIQGFFPLKDIAHDILKATSVDVSEWREGEEQITKA